MKKCKECLCQWCDCTEKYLHKLAPIANVIVRFYMANLVFMFGLDKIQNWDATVFLFENEFVAPILPSIIWAGLITAIELIAPILLVIGYNAKIAALFLFSLTLVSNFFYQQTVDNYYWMLIFAMLMSYGADKFSMDHYLHHKRNSAK